MDRSNPTKIVTVNLDTKISNTDFQLLLLWIVYSRRFRGAAYVFDEVYERAISVQSISPVTRPMITKLYWRPAADGLIQFYKAEELFFEGLEQSVSDDYDFSENRLAKDAINWVLESIETVKKEKDKTLSWFDAK